MGYQAWSKEDIKIYLLEIGWESVIQEGELCVDRTGFPGAQLVKNPPALQEAPVWFLGQKDPLDKG